MPFLDANVFIFAELSSEREGELARAILRALAVGKFKGFINPLIVDEVIWKVRKEVDYKTGIAIGKGMLKFSNLEIKPITQETLGLAVGYMEVGLKPRDAIHVACMVENNIKEIVSEDPEFKSVKSVEVFSFSQFLKRLEMKKRLASRYSN